MYNKTVCEKSTGKIKYMLVGSDAGFLMKVEPGPSEFAVSLNEADYGMATRNIGGFTITLNPDGSYTMTQIAEPAKEEPEIKAEPVKPEKKKK
jgi:hypothetical protein